MTGAPDPMRCSDPPAESCSDANCPVHGDRYGDGFWDADEAPEGGQP